MTPAVYKTIVAISVLPTMEEDGFLSGKYFEDTEGNNAEDIRNTYKFVFIIVINVFILYFS